MEELDSPDPLLKDLPPGYNISKMNPKDLMIVQPLCTFDDLVTYWEVAKNICFKSRVLNKRSFNNDSYVPKVRPIFYTLYPTL